MSSCILNNRLIFFYYYSFVSSQESGTKPLTFTFIPSIGQLPTHFEVVDISKFLVTIPEEPKDLSNQNIVNKSDAVSDELVLKSGAKQGCVSTVCAGSTRTAFPPLGCHSSKGEMQENDLFKAEFILITDSGDEDEVAAASSNVHQPSNGYSPISAQLLTTSHVSPGTEAGKPPGDGSLSSMSKISSSASKSWYSTPRLSDNLQTPSLYNPDCVCKAGGFTTSSVPARSPTLSSNSPCSTEIQGSLAQSISPSSSKKRNALSPLPVHIITHSLSPSPKPLSPPSLYGSSSTICSINEPCTQTLSRGTLAKSGVKSPLPTRLTLLTAILRSGSSQRRPLSPASCPTFSPSSLSSSTLTIDQKFKTTPPTPKKSLSSPPVRPDSPSKEDYWLSGWAQHLSLPSKSHPTPQARSLSPKKHPPVQSLSPDCRNSLSSPLSSLRRSRVHTYSPIFTCRSYPLLASPSPSGALSPPPEKHSSPSPSFLHSPSRSRSDSSQTSVQEISASSPTSSRISKQWSLPRPHSTPLAPRTGNINSHSLQLNSSLVQENFRSNSSSPRSEHSATSSVIKCRSPISDKSPGTLPSRLRELTSPQSFSLPPDHENIKPKQYKIKTSYKAFAAIPTNTLLMEQKALEEPTKPASVTEGTALDTHSEMCSPAQLRQQTEELCAVIDQVLQDPLTMVTHQCMSTTLQRAAGRETRYVSTFAIALCFTKPGVIRPVLVKGKSAQQKEEPYQPNPFKKYLEEISDQNIEQVKDCLLHPQYPTKLISPTKSPLCPPSMSLTDCPNPGLSATSLPLCVMFMRILIALTDTTLCTIR
uniref:Muscular LMNA interacting protein n=1 Tax=Serinus canaria TaxID=9135 RepID=A0A8C9NB49_SERCA